MKISSGKALYVECTFEEIHFGTPLNDIKKSHPDVDVIIMQSHLGTEIAYNGLIDVKES